VQDHLSQICSKANWVGHGVKADLKVLGMGKIPYVDTGFFEDLGLSELVMFKRRNPRKLKEIAADHLNAVI
jgi:hypothetical protein